MSVKKFRFVSPGIQIAEIDNSQLPKISAKVGPVVIGRSERGPGMRPVKVESFSDFVTIFGNPIPGGQGGDVWRDGNYTAPTYGPYAAQAWLKNNSPLTYVRLLGYTHSDATAGGEAGWETRDYAGNANGLGILDSDGGAYGLFIINSSSAGALTTSLVATDLAPQTGSLAAIFYVNEGSIVLTGSGPDGAGNISGSAVLVKSIGADKEFKVVIRDRDSNVVKTTSFNFNRNSQKYIRKVLNTNPTLTNPDISQGANTASYWLGPTFERHLDTYVTSGSVAGDCFGVILGLKGAAAADEGSDFRLSSQEAKTGWFFSQDPTNVGGAANTYQPENMIKLFRLHCLDTGEWTQANLKVSIQDIRVSTNPFDTYGTFTVLLRKSDDNDNAVQVVERFSQCSLNPASPNYIAKKIGDKYMTWDDDERRYREYGNYDNQSRFIRVELNPDVDAGAIEPTLLPYGVYGPSRFRGFTLLSGATTITTPDASEAGAAFTNAHVRAAQNIVRSKAIGTAQIYAGTLSFTGSFRFPTIMTRSSTMEGDLASPKSAYFGVMNTVSTTSTRPDPGFKDLVRVLPAAYDIFSADNDKTEYSWIFSLDNLVQTGSHALHTSGSRAAGTSITAQGNYTSVLDAGFDKYSAPLFGGFDGLDIAEKEPFNNTDLNGGTETTNYAFNSVKRAIDSISDPEVVEFNVATVPGLTNEGLTSHLLNVCSDRSDALAIIDLAGGFVPGTENADGDSASGNRGSVDTTVSNLRSRGINSSYGCAYYPWVQIRDTINGATLWAPPSIAALGVMGSSETKSEIWFAPAGFNRGGLTEGSAGVPVVGVREKLTSKQRDKLYEANINPIASFPSEGIVVFGQKTLQVTPSALDRVNVRRMLIFLKKEISRMAATILFDQNVAVTWNRFKGKVEPFLLSVKVRLGLTDYKVVLDETTTTPDLVDRNVMYGKIFLKPARAIEFIALDFNITSTGASFAD